MHLNYCKWEIILYQFTLFLFDIYFSDWAIINDKMSMADESNEDFKLQGMPAFYGSLSPNCWNSSIDSKYDRFSTPDVNNHTLSLCQTLLRTSLLESSSESFPSCDNTAGKKII